MYKMIFEVLKEPLDLPISPLNEYLLLLVINVIAFQIAWKASPGGKWGSEIHWFVRIPIFLLIWAITYSVIFVSKWLINNWVLVICALLGVLTIVGITVIFLRKNRI